MSFIILTADTIKVNTSPNTLCGALRKSALVCRFAAVSVAVSDPTSACEADSVQCKHCLKRNQEVSPVSCLHVRDS